MNPRVLELLKTPKNIQSEDLNLLKDEINSFPYVQNIRALYLYGVNLYDKDNYQKVLSATAAYTTDKKILYQLINGKIQPKPEAIKAKPDYAENPLKILYQSKVTNFPIKRKDDVIDDIEKETENLLVQEVSVSKREMVLPAPRPEIKHLNVNGEINRILFEGEENFLEDDEVETIDLESTLESGSIITQKTERKEEISVVEENVVQEVQDQENVEEIEEFTPETIIEEENINSESEKQEILDESEVSFHETESIQAEVQNAEVEENEVVEEIAEFTPETIIQEENIHSETEKEEILDESEVSFHETESIQTEIQDNDAEEAKENVIAKSEEISNTEEIAEFTPEKIIDEDEISSEKEKSSVNDSAELSFHGTESFLPDVKIQVNNSDEIKEDALALESNTNKHEDEMRRLIEKVEKKMREKADSTIIQEVEESDDTNNDISFAETQSFEVKPAEPTPEARTEDVQPQSEAIKESKEEIIIPEEVQSSWKPMSFESNVPDSLLDKSIQTPQPKAETVINTSEEIKKEDVPVIEEVPELVEDQSNEFGEQTNELQIDIETPAIEEKENVPVMNVSFFGSDISKLKSLEAQKEIEKEEIKEVIEVPVKKVTPNPIDSNVPGFINTWQSWLKIDRNDEVEDIEPIQKEKVELKNKVIETFIENNPKISQLKDEASYVVKERNDDISHLMTETLANLYFEQKLYTKAIKAFGLLIQKTPEKKEYYESRIQEIKDFKSK